MSVSTSTLTKPFHYAIGVFQGCVLSPVLFNICFQPLLDLVSAASKAQGWSYTFKSDSAINRDVSAFADDIELCSWHPTLCQEQINICDRYLSWSRSMQARPNKCSATAMRQSNSVGSSGTTGFDRFDPHLSIAGASIRYLDDGDFRYLGRLLNTAASEITSRCQLQEKLDALLSLLDNTLLPATSRLWLYHHFVVPKLSWAFLTLDLTLTFVKKLQAKSLVFLKKWVGLPRCANTAILFVGDRHRPGLKVHNLCTYWKQQQGVKFELLRNSADPRCRKLHATVLARQGSWRKRFAPAVEVACASTVVQSNLTTASRPPSSVREGLGLSKPANSQTRPSSATLRQRLSSHLRVIDVEEQLSRLKTLQLQGRWLEWSGLMNLDLSWQQLIHNWSDKELRFALQATTNTAPTPLNLRRWGHQSVDPSCQLCGRPASLRHILNACPSALNQGRYTWRHDSVLRILKRHLLSFWQSPLTQNTIRDRANLSTQPYIRFVPAGSASTQSTRRPTHLYSNTRHKRHPLSSSKDLLLNSNDWEFLFDLGDSQLVFPPEIAVTTQRPDIVIFSRSKKAVLLVELTVPLEDRVAAGHTRKENRYAGLVQQCTENGWFARCFAVEVGCLGYVSPSLLHCLDSLGIPSSTSRKLRNECSRVAHRCSYVLFLRRNCVDWTSWSMGWPFHLLKAALVLLSVLIWQLAFSPFMYFPLPQTCSPMPTAATMLALCASLFPLSGLPALPTMITLSSRSQIRMRSRRNFSQCACVFLRFNPHAQSQIFHNAHAYFTVAWLWPAFIHAHGRTPARLKLKVLVAMDVRGFARGLTSSDALICCQDHAVILMADKTDPAWGLIRSWWRIEVALRFLLYSSTVTNYLRWPCLAVPSFYHNNPTFASRWQIVFYTGSAPHVVLSDRVSVSLRSSMHIKIDMAFLVVPRLVHPICFLSSFASWFSSLTLHICVLVCDPTRSVARA